MPVQLESSIELITAAAMAFLAIGTWRQTHQPAMRSFVAAMCFGVIWALEIAVELEVHNPELKLMLARVRPLAHLGIYTMLTLMAIQHSRSFPRAGRKLHIALLIVPVITFALSFGENRHGLFRHNYRLITHGSVLAATSDKGPWNTAMVSYEYLLVIVAFVIMVRAALLAQVEFRAPTVSIAAAWAGAVGVIGLEQGGVISVPHRGYAPWNAKRATRYLPITSDGWGSLRMLSEVFEDCSEMSFQWR
jgi:hypothetical protein